MVQNCTGDHHSSDVGSKEGSWLWKVGKNILAFRPPSLALFVPHQLPAGWPEYPVQSTQHINAFRHAAAGFVALSTTALSGPIYDSPLRLIEGPSRHL